MMSYKFYAVDPDFTLNKILGLKGQVGDIVIGKYEIKKETSGCQIFLPEFNFLFLVINNKESDMNGDSSVYLLENIMCVYLRTDRDNNERCDWARKKKFENINTN